jgi:hypothetical protein
VKPSIATVSPSRTTSRIASAIEASLDAVIGRGALSRSRWGSPVQYR